MKSLKNGLVVVFLALILAFMLIAMGAGIASDGLMTVGFVLMLAALFYSPIRIHIWKR